MIKLLNMYAQNFPYIHFDCGNIAKQHKLPFQQSNIVSLKNLFLYMLIYGDLLLFLLLMVISFPYYCRLLHLIYLDLSHED